MTAIVWSFEHSLHCRFLGLEWKLTFFSPVATAELSKSGILAYWHIELSTLAASSFKIWNSSTGIPSLPLAFFIVMLPKAHLTLHKMSGHRWVIKPSWSSGSLRSFWHSSSGCSYHLFSIPSVSVRSIPFLSFTVPIFAWTIPLAALIFLKRSLVFPHSIVSLYFFALFT